MRAAALRSDERDHPRFALPTSQMSKLVTEAWNKTFAVLENPLGGASMTSEEIFDVVVAAMDRYVAPRGNEGDVRVRLYLEHESPLQKGRDHAFYSLVNEPQRFLPRRSDRTFARYFERVQPQLGGLRFGLILNEAEMHDWTHWFRMKELLTGITDAVGVAPGRAYSVLFIGNYLHTPFGIHKDSEHVFTFVVEGTKKMAVWPLETFADRPEVPPDPTHRKCILSISDHAAAMKSATVLEGRPGDMMYWPPSHWHCSEPSEGISVTATLVTNFDSASFNPIESSNIRAPFRIAASELSSTKGSRPYAVPQSVLDAATENTGNQEAIERRVKIRWLEFATRLGLRGVPAADPVRAVTSTSSVKALGDSPILWTWLDAETIAVAGNGRSIVLPFDPRIPELVAALNAKRTLRVRELERTLSGRAAVGSTRYEMSRAVLRRILSTLGSWRTLKVVS